MGLQGIVYDWYGPAHMASIHGMRDFGNSNHDTMWTDLILPKLVNTERYVSRIAIHNASGDGVSEALLATPEIIVRDADGTEIVRKTLDVMNPYCTVMLDIRDLIGDAAVDVGTLQIRDPEAGLVAMSFTYDTVNDGITSADHFFDRHFVVDSTGFTG